MAASYHYKIEVLPREESDIQPLEEDTITTARENECAAFLTNNTITSRGSNRRCCLNSNAAILILVWNLTVAYGLEFFFYTIAATSILPFNTLAVRVIMYSLSSLSLLFYPLAGYLADTRWGRHETIVGSLRFVLLSLAMIFILGSLGTAGSIPVLLCNSDPLNNMVGKATIAVICLVFGLPIVFGILLIICSFIAFSANVIQYGIDQLVHDDHSEDITCTLYICWYVWTVYLAEFIIKIPHTLLGPFFSWTNLGILMIVLPTMFGVVFCIKKCKRQWIFVDSKPQDQNPYKLAFQITRSVTNHENIHSENDLEFPSSRFDVGEENNGGPFEEAKSFPQIFCILLTLGPTLMVDIGVHELLPNLVFHMDKYGGLRESALDQHVYGPYHHEPQYNLLKSLISGGALTPLIIIVLLPLYIVLLRPYIYSYIPGALKRIGLGMVFILLSALCTLSMDTYGHIHGLNSTACFFLDDKYYDYWYDYWNDIPIETLQISSYFLTVQSILNAIGYMLLYISTFEFICTQSPQPMKGLLICSFFAIKGAFRLLGVVVIFAPFTQWKLHYAFPSCGFAYYLVNSVLVLAGMVAFTIVAKKYRYQGEPDHENRYHKVEGYSSVLNESS